MSNLRTFISRRIAEEEVMHHATISSKSTASPKEKYWADARLEDCTSKRWTLDFHEKAGASGEVGASTAWATLNVVLMHMAHQWRHHPDFDKTWDAA